MGIFEAGILTKMTEDEYRNLGRRKKSSPEQPTSSSPNYTGNTSTNISVLPASSTVDNKLKDTQPKQTTQVPIDEDENRLKPISTKMLQGAFYLLGFGYIIAGMTVLIEIMNHKHDRHYKRLKKQKFQSIRKLKASVVYAFRRVHFYIHRKYRMMMNEAIVATLDYVE